MGLSATLGPGRLAFDTAVFIYFIEENPDYLPLIAPLFEEIAGGTREVVTSARYEPPTRSSWPRR